jgi:hypothetical protein
VELAVEFCEVELAGERRVHPPHPTISLVTGSSTTYQVPQVSNCWRGVVMEGRTFVKVSLS